MEPVPHFLRDVDGANTAKLLRAYTRSEVGTNGLPTWVTVSDYDGEAMAAGPLLPHEETLLAQLGGAQEAAPRAFLNAWHLSEAGMARLHSMRTTGRYRTDVPEEGALLMIACLSQPRTVHLARGIFDIVQPLFSRLRFYPVPHDEPLKDGSALPVREVIDGKRLAGALPSLLAWVRAASIDDPHVRCLWIALERAVNRCHGEPLGNDAWPQLRGKPWACVTAMGLRTGTKRHNQVARRILLETVDLALAEEALSSDLLTGLDALAREARYGGLESFIPHLARHRPDDVDRFKALCGYA